MSTIDDAMKLSKALKLPNSAIVYLFDDVSPKDGLDPVETAIDLLNTVPKLITEARAQEQEIARLKENNGFITLKYAEKFDECRDLQDQVATAREGQQRILKAWDDWYDGPDTMISGDMIEAILALKAEAIPTSDRERRLEEARACKHGTWTIGLICVDCGQSRGKPDWTWYDMVTF